MTRDEVVKLLAILTTVWDSAMVDDLKITGFTMALAPFPAEAVYQAAAKHMQLSRFFPLPADLLALVADQVETLSTGEAWEEVQRNIRRHGFQHLSEIQWSSHAIAVAVLAVGWRRLCLEDNSQGYIRRDFDVAYENARERARKAIQSGDIQALPGGAAGLQVRAATALSLEGGQS